jgi:hypothetical protein
MDHSFCLSHLQRKYIKYIQKGRADKPPRIYTVTIDYGNHVYSRKCLESDSSYFKDRDGNPRVFDYRRYVASFELPSLMEGLMSSTIYDDGKDGYRVGTTLKIDGVDVEYLVFFKVWASKQNGLTLRVKTAYPRDDAHGKNKATGRRINLSVILYRESKLS